MATSKLLKPTNVTISIPEFTDQPDQRVNSNCIDKEADAINTLSEHLTNFLKKEHISAKPSSALAAGAKGYWAVPVHDCKNKTVISTEIALGHPGNAGGYSLTAAYTSGNYCYVSYYTPISLNAADADFTVDIIYTDDTITTVGYVENL